MNKFVKKLSCKLLVICLFFSLFNINSYANAQEIKTNKKINELEDKITEKLQNIGIENPEVNIEIPMSRQEGNLIKNNVDLSRDKTSNNEEVNEEIIDSLDPINDNFEQIVDEEDVVIQIVAEDDKGKAFETGIGLSLGNNNVTIISSTDGEEKEYSIEIKELTDEDIAATITDVDTNKKEFIDTSDANNGTYHNSWFWVPALGIAVGSTLLADFALAVGATAIIYFAAIGALNLYSGVLWIAGYIAEQQPKNKRFYHYQARTVNNKYGIFVGPGLSYTKAVARLKSKGNIWSISSYYAQKAAKAASSYSDTLHHSAHSQRAGIRTYNHYHPKGLLGVHSFYGQGRLN